MSTKKTFLQLLGFALVFTSANALARAFVLKNNSHFDIHYSYNNAEHLNTYSTMGGTLLKPGQTVHVADKQQVAIMRYGVGSNIISSWTTVPYPDELAAKTLDKNKLGHYLNSVNADNPPFIYIGTGYTLGWHFSIGY